MGGARRCRPSSNSRRGPGAAAGRAPGDAGPRSATIRRTAPAPRTPRGTRCTSCCEPSLPSAASAAGPSITRSGAPSPTSPRARACASSTCRSSTTTFTCSPRLRPPRPCRAACRRSRSAQRARSTAASGAAARCSRTATTARTSPARARRAAYVLNNWRKHREDQATPAARAACLDPYSTALQFDGWACSVPGDRVTTIEPLPSASPATWLLRIGWRRHGPIDPRAVPGRPP